MGDKIGDVALGHWSLPKIVALPKHSAKDLLSVTLGKQHTASTVPANVSLPSVFYRALDKYFAES